MKRYSVIFFHRHNEHQVKVIVFFLFIFTCNWTFVLDCSCSKLKKKVNSKLVGTIQYNTIQYNTVQYNTKSIYMTIFPKGSERLQGNLNGCGMGPLLVLVFPCFRENVNVTCKIGSFLCSLDNLFQKNVIVFFFGNQISICRDFWPTFHIV